MIKFKILFLLLFVFQNNLFAVKKEITLSSNIKNESRIKINGLKAIKTLGEAFGATICLHMSVSMLNWLDGGMAENSVEIVMDHIKCFLNEKMGIKGKFLNLPAAKLLPTLLITPALSLFSIYLAKMASKNLDEIIETKSNMQKVDE